MTTIKIDRTEATVAVTRGDPIISVTRAGPPGPTGATGPQGPQGPPGTSGEGASATTIHVQGSTSREWLIQHNLDRYPSVTIVDSAGTVVIGGVHYVDSNTLIVSFDYPFSGKAYLN